MPAPSRALSAPTILPGLWLALAALIFASLTLAAHADERVVRIGYQKYGTLVLLKGRGNLEPKLRALGYRVQWSDRTCPLEIKGGPSNKHGKVSILIQVIGCY